MFVMNQNSHSPLIATTKYFLDFICKSRAGGIFFDRIPRYCLTAIEVAIALQFAPC
jgi:hypothetical protein